MTDVLIYGLLYAPAALLSGLVLGLAGSRDFKRGLLRGALNGTLLLGAMAALILLVQLATEPSVL
jgi:hypothetical protein